MKKTLFTILILLSSVLFCLAGCKNTPAKDSGNSSQILSNIQSENELPVTSTIVNFPYSQKEMYDAGKQIHDWYNSSTKNEIIARVNGAEVTRGQLDYLLLIYKDRTDSKHIKDAFIRLLKEVVARQRAESLFKIEDSEVLKKAEENYNIWNSTDKSKKQFEAYCNGLEIEPSEYIDFMKPIMRDDLLSSKIFEYVSNEHANSEHNLDMTREEYYKDYVDKLYNSADIEILDDALK